MTDEKPHGREREPQSTRKENNPFSEQEKHGDEAQRQAPGFNQEYQGGQPEQRHAPGVGDAPLDKRSEENPGEQERQPEPGAGARA